MPLTQIDYTLHSTNRTDVRKEVVSLFLLEQPGTGKGDDCSKYWYNVEQIEGYSTLLKRPVPLNKGFDFTVNTNSLYFKKNRRYTNPSHDDIVSALRFVKIANPDKYIFIHTALTNIYNCQSYDPKRVQGLYFSDYAGVDHPIEIILLAVKWLFIEQDIRYWNWSGRNMLWNEIKDI